MGTLPRATHVLDTLAQSAGGPPRSVKGLCESLARVGCSINLCTVDHSARAGPSIKIDESLVKLLSVPGGRFPKILCPSGLGEMLRQPVQEADVVHTHGIWMPAYRCAVQTAREYRKPLAISIRGVLDPLSFGQKRWKKELALLWYARKSLDYAGCCIAAASLEETHFRDFGIKGPIAVIPNGLTVWPYLKREQQSSRAWLAHSVPVLKGKRILLFLARLHPQKGTVFLIDAWAALHRKFPDWQLVMAGPDCNGHQAELEARARSHGCARSITFLGEVYGSRKATVYSASDLFILPSISESFPRVVLEALAAAVPVISTTGTPWQDLVKYKCGWWVDAAIGPLTEAMRDGMSMTDGQRSQAGLRGRELVVARYDWSTIATQHVSLYNWLCSGGPPPDCVHLDSRGTLQAIKPAATPSISNVTGDRQPAARPSPVSSPAITHVISWTGQASGGPSAAVAGMCEALGRAGCAVDLCMIDRSAHVGPRVEIDQVFVHIRTVPGRGRIDRYTCPARFKGMLEVSVRQSDVIHTHGLWDPTLPPAAMLARKLQKPMVMTIHGMLDPLSFAHSAWKKRLALLAVIRSSLNTAGCYHATSPLEESHLRQFGLRGPVAVIPNGLDIAIFLKHDHQTSRQWLTWNLPILRDQRILLFLSRIHPQKGTAMLIDAWAGLGRDFPDWRLVIAGPDCLGHRAELEARAKDKGCAQRVVFMGPVSADDKAMLYAAADLFVLPSISECFGIVIAESLASGVPVIATTGAPWQELQEHRCGWWVDAALAPLTEALREGMSLPQQAREEAGLRGRELVASKYCWPAIGGQMVSMYNWLRSGGTPPEYVHLE